MLHLLHCEQLVSVNQTIRFQSDHRKEGLLPESGQSLSPQICSLLQKLVILKPVSVGPVLVDDLLKVGKPLPVELGDLLVPEPVGIVWNVGQGPVSADLHRVKLKLETERVKRGPGRVRPGGKL